jgi:hypothetical protein
VPCVVSAELKTEALRSLYSQIYAFASRSRSLMQNRPDVLQQELCVTSFQKKNRALLIIFHSY